MKIQCPRCHNAMELPPASETPQEVFCRACMSRQSYLTFPAFEREPIRGQVATPILERNAASPSGRDFLAVEPS